jgi:CubicO group peptidase (beta-lactamase class C family)
MRIIVILQFLIVSSSLAQKSLEQAIDDLVTPYVASNNFAGTIYVARFGTGIYQKSFGKAVLEWNVPNSINTKYHLASVSKPFTSASILMLEQLGKLKTTDPVSKYLPDFIQGDKITIHHLLSHTSGIVNINDFPEYDAWSLTTMSLDSIIKSLRKKPLLFAPGTKYSYSNSNYNVLAYIIEKVSGLKYGVFLKENIFDVLKMSNTSHHDSPATIIPNLANGYSPEGRNDFKRSPYLDWTIKTGNGSLYSTAEDLAKFDRILFTDKLLNKTERDKMFTNNLSEVGYGWFLKSHLRRKRTYMTGRSPGFSTYFARYPDEQLCIIVLSNLYLPSTKEIGENAASIIFNEQPIIRHLKDEPLRVENAELLKGTYQFGSDFFNPNFKMEIKETNGQLSCSFGELIRDTDDDFILRRFWSIIHFEKDASQKITGLTFDGVRATRVEK